ncbi:MAG: hypothetical protein ACK47B_21950 [Armatimonadota bacterium]
MISRRSVVSWLALALLAATGLFAARPALAHFVWGESPSASAPELDSGGGTIGLTVKFDSAVNYDRVVTLTGSSSGPSFSIPQSVTVTAGNTSAPYQMTYGSGSFGSDWINIHMSDGAASNNHRLYY